MSKERFDHMMALWTKGKEFETETSMDGSIVVYPKHYKEKVYAVIDPEKMKALASSKGTCPIGFVNADSDLFAEIAAKELLRHDFASYAYVSAYHRRHWSERRREVFRRMVEDVGGEFRAVLGVQADFPDRADDLDIGLVGMEVGDFLDGAAVDVAERVQMNQVSHRLHRQFAPKERRPARSHARQELDVHFHRRLHHIAKIINLS